MTDAVSTAVARDDRETWWHRHSGPVLGESPSLVEALEYEGLDFNAEVRPLASQDADGGWTEDSRRFGVVRDDTDELIGVVKQRYCPVQYRDALAFVDDITLGYDAAIDKLWGSPDGARMRLAVQYKHDVDIAGIDTARPYLFFSAGHDGLTSVRMQVSAVQASCLNQLPDIFAQGQGIAVVHSSKSMDRLRVAADVISQADEYMQRLSAEFSALAMEQLSDQRCERIVAQCVHRHVKSAKGREDDVAGILQLASDSPTMPAGFAGTKMGLVHAATEYYDHFRPYRNAAVLRRENLYGRAAQMRKSVFEAVRA